MAVEVVYTKKIFDINNEKIDINMDISEDLGKEEDIDLIFKANVSCTIEIEYSDPEYSEYISNLKIDDLYISIIDENFNEIILNKDKEFKKKIINKLKDFIIDNQPFDVRMEIDEEKIVDDFIYEEIDEIVNKYNEINSKINNEIIDEILEKNKFNEEEKEIVNHIVKNGWDNSLNKDDLEHFIEEKQTELKKIEVNKKIKNILKKLKNIKGFEVKGDTIEFNPRLLETENSYKQTIEIN